VKEKNLPLAFHEKCQPSPNVLRVSMEDDFFNSAEVGIVSEYICGNRKVKTVLQEVQGKGTVATVVVVVCIAIF
jgi:hypothetical protein